VGQDRSVLVNFVYCPPIGHAIEALHYCHGYHHANPGLRIGLALNADTPAELAALCPYVGDVYQIPVDISDPAYDPAAALPTVPTGWDWVVDDDRGHQPDQRMAFPGLARYYDQAGDRFSATGSIIGTAGAAPPRYSPGQDFRLPLPDGRRAEAGRLLGITCAGSREQPRPRIALLPAGSGPRGSYPSLRSWRLVLTALADRWPDALFCLIGKYRLDGRTTTSFGRAELDELRDMVPATVGAVDLPVISQLAAVAACDVLVSPHTGFGMAALAVGTPWLSIAGNRWPEYYFNGVPFYSVLPDLRKFPAYGGLDLDPEPVNDDGPRAPSMCYERIQSDLAEIVDGAARLVEHRWQFQTAMADHVARMLALRAGREDMLWSIDSVHKRYLPGTA
jgi:hypothetical protein